MKKKEELIQQAIELFNKNEVLKITMLQKFLGISYPMAGNIINTLIVAGTIMPSNGAYVLKKQHESQEELYCNIIAYCKKIGSCSVSSIQREFNICYDLACAFAERIHKVS